MRNKILVLILISMIGCKTQQQQSNLEMISDRIGDNAIIDYNTDRTFALIQEKYSVVQSGVYTSSYMVIRLSDNEVIKEGKVVEGYIKWVNEDIIEIFEMPGVIRDGQDEDDFKKQINVREFLKQKPEVK